MCEEVGDGARDAGLVFGGGGGEDLVPASALHDDAFSSHGGSLAPLRRAPWA
jgi:hypothetical protein